MTYSISNIMLYNILIKNVAQVNKSCKQDGGPRHDKISLNYGDPRSEWVKNKSQFSTNETFKTQNSINW